jgi:peptidoglycan/xylan/chitin deacetylase (PgdA/CDA1 family)
MLKELVVRATESRSIASVIARILHLGPSIFTLHRFEHRDLGIKGHPPATLRADLELVRKLRVPVLPLDDFVQRWLAGTLSARSVAFTVDDGYRDFVDCGVPIFQAFDCPVTIFATTGFVDGKLWFWWDQLEHVLLSTKHTELTVTLPGAERQFSWSNETERSAAWLAMVILLKGYDADVQRRVVGETATRLEIDVPRDAPPRFAPMTWGACNAHASQGVTVGPHSVNHFNLARVEADVARAEIAESWARIRDAAVAPVPIFCYPYGDPSAFNAQVASLARECGLRAAVSFVDRRLRARPRVMSDEQFMMPRLRYEDDSHLFSQQLTGVDDLKRAVRRR